MQLGTFERIVELRDVVKQEARTSGVRLDDQGSVLELVEVRFDVLIAGLGLHVDARDRAGHGKLAAFALLALDGIVQLPLVLPPVAMGFLLLIIFGTRGGVGAFLKDHFGIVLVFRWTGAVLASAIFTFPFQVRAIRLALEARDTGLDEAARSLGAGWVDRLINVTLPLALPGLVAGAITAFAGSLGEFGAIITFVSNIPGETRTLPLAIYTALQTPGGGAEAARLSGLSILLAFIFLFAAQLIMRRATAGSER